MVTLKLDNFAKLKDTALEINDITLIAGKPGSGKSYIMKILYAIKESLHLSLIDFSNDIKKANELHNEVKLAQLEIENLIKRLEFLNENEIKKLEDKVAYSNKKIGESSNLLEMNRINKKISTNLSNLLNSIFSDYEQISNKFQINYENSEIKYANKKLKINSKFNDEFVAENTIFIETPLILEFKSFMTKDSNKIPYHISSLLKILEKDYSFTDEIQDEFVKEFTKKSKEIINGNIENSGDSFIYKKGDKNYDIVNASSGIKSIGLLQYLVTNKALKQGSVLFWEEPEVHLHPSWQLKMVELFLELQKNGVRIVFSTHSPYMADYLNALVKKRKLEDKVSFNLLTEEKDGIVENIVLNDDNWYLLQKELLGALEDIMWEYL